MSNELSIINDNDGFNNATSGASNIAAAWNENHEKWLRDHPYERRDIGNVDFKGLDLSGINLDRVKVTGDFTGCNLTEMQADYADFTGLFSKPSTFKDAILNDAVIKHSILRVCNIQTKEMRNCSLEGSEVGHANFSGVTAENLNLERTGGVGYADFTGATLVNPNLELSNLINGPTCWGSTIIGGDFTKISGPQLTSNFRGATLINNNFSEISLTQSDFTDANISGAIFTGSTAHGASFKNAIAHHTDFNTTKFGISEYNFQGADLRGANFLGNEVKGFLEVNFRGATYNDQTQFPEGVDPEKLGMIYSREQVEKPDIGSWTKKIPSRQTNTTRVARIIDNQHTDGNVITGDDIIDAEFVRLPSEDNPTSSPKHSQQNHKVTIDVRKLAKAAFAKFTLSDTNSSIKNEELASLRMKLIEAVANSDSVDAVVKEISAFYQKNDIPEPSAGALAERQLTIVEEAKARVMVGSMYKNG